MGLRPIGFGSGTNLGVEEVRALVSTMIQSEKWGTSIGTVPQVYAETLRRNRRQVCDRSVMSP